VKKGRHRRFEEARKLKQQGPGAFLLPETRNGRHDHNHVDDEAEPEDDFSDLAAKYGAFDDDEEPDEEK
jgi:hypothetical protein